MGGWLSKQRIFGERISRQRFYESVVGVEVVSVCVCVCVWMGGLLSMLSPPQPPGPLLSDISYKFSLCAPAHHQQLIVRNRLA